MRKLLGSPPLPAYNKDGDRYAIETGPMPHDPTGRMPIPKWDGSDIATKIKPWLEDLQQWRGFTVNSTAPRLAAWQLQMSFPVGSWMRRCAGLVPRTRNCKPYTDAELDVALERFLYVRRRPKGQSFAQCITHLKKSRDYVCDTLGQEKFECSKCGHVEHKKHKIPAYMWRYLIINTCDASKEEKRLMLHWHHDYADSKKLVELLLKLDATHDLDIASVAHDPGYRTDMSNYASKSFSTSRNYVGHSQAESQSYMVHDLDQPAGDSSVLPIPSDLFTSEACTMLARKKKLKPMTPQVLVTTKWCWMKIISRRISTLRWIHTRIRTLIMNCILTMDSLWLTVRILRLYRGKKDACTRKLSFITCPLSRQHIEKYVKHCNIPRLAETTRCRTLREFQSLLSP